MNRFVIERAKVKDDNNEFLPAKKLEWHYFTDEATRDSANIKRIELQKSTNDYYFRVLEIK